MSTLQIILDVADISGRSRRYRRRTRRTSPPAPPVTKGGTASASTSSSRTTVASSRTARSSSACATTPTGASGGTRTPARTTAFRSSSRRLGATDPPRRFGAVASRTEPLRRRLLHCPGATLRQRLATGRSPARPCLSMCRPRAPTRLPFLRRHRAHSGRPPRPTCIHTCASRSTARLHRPSRLPRSFRPRQGLSPLSWPLIMHVPPLPHP